VTDDATGRDVHPELDLLADLDAGVDVDADVRTHASTCAQCQQALAALRATRADLAALPTTPMPDDVAARIDAVLAQEAPQGSATPADGTVVSMPDLRMKKRRSSNIASGIAASVVVLLVAAVVVNAFSSGGKSNGGGATSNGAALGTSSTSVVTTSGHNYTQQNLDQNVAALLATPTAFAAGSQGQAGHAATGAGPAKGATPAPKAQSPAPAPRGPAASGNMQAFAIPPQLAALQTDPNAMTQCIHSLLGSPPYVAPLAVDLAAYDGKPAAIFVFPKADDTSHVRVYVVPPGGCANGFFEFFKNSVPR